MDTLEKNVFIVGMGEIGNSLKQVYEDFSSTYNTYGIDLGWSDLDSEQELIHCDVMNICLPYCDEFENIVLDYIQRHSPVLVIIHSTVPPGTSRAIIQRIASGNLESLVVHSPVRGIHPNLYEGIKTFVKYVGAESDRSRKSAQMHLQSLGIKVESLENSIATELAKILDTCYYGLCIAWHGEMSRIFSDYSLDFMQNMAPYNHTYNEGYRKLGMDHVVRPELYPPTGSPPKIGGHCVVPNTALAQKFSASLAYELIMKYS